jgi:hypothetical protein
MEVTWERSNATDDRVRILVWATGGDFEAFEAGLRADDTVATPDRVIRVDDRRLYKTELIGEGLRTSTYPLMVEEGGVFQRLRGSVDGWEFRAAFPDRSSFARLVEFCREKNVGFEFRRLYDGQAEAPSSEYGLTRCQRETLVRALERGYFEVPRDCSLAELAASLGVSESAASERLRRATATLVARTVGDG